MRNPCVLRRCGSSSSGSSSDASFGEVVGLLHAAAELHVAVGGLEETLEILLKGLTNMLAGQGSIDGPHLMRFFRVS